MNRDHSAVKQAAQHAVSLQMTDVVGIWSRSLLAYPDGRHDDTSVVTWLQGQKFFGDLRQPDGLDIAATCLDDLDLDSMEVLARQEGFAGVLVQHEDHFEWERLIDFQPKSRHADRGRLHRDGELLVETGVEVAYREHWHLQPGATTPTEGILVADVQTNRMSLLVMVGSQFFFARDRAAPLPPGGTLVDQVRAASSLEIARTLIDCEISIGMVEEEWRITASTLPWRKGFSISPHLDSRSFVFLDTKPDGHPVSRRWPIVQQEISLRLPSSDLGA